LVPRGGVIGTNASFRGRTRRKIFDLARLNKAPIAIQTVERMDALFAIERETNGKTPQECERVRKERSRPLVSESETWLCEICHEKIPPHRGGNVTTTRPRHLSAPITGMIARPLSVSINGSAS
jgi:hypothetical protein